VCNANWCQTTKDHGEPVAIVHPRLGNRGMSGEGEGVGVVNNEAHVDTWPTLGLMATVLVTEPFC